MDSVERTALIGESVDKQNEQSRKDEKPLRTHRLWCKDEWRDFAVYRVPTDALLLNIDNRRFSAERELVEEQLGHALDPENNPNDEISVISILLDSGVTADGDIAKGTPSKGYLQLKTDWEKRKQESPFWIRTDGTVHNGNRRLAMLKRMRAGEGIEGTRYVDAIILDPNDIDDNELFEMEQREQLTENFKQRYTDINLLRTLREAAIARKIDWNNPTDIERVAGELQDRVEGGKGYAEIQLWAIKYMDDYLNDRGSPGKYHMLMGQIERFRDVGKNMVRMIEDHPEDAADMLRIQFAGIDAGVKHGHIRTIGKMYRESRDEFHRMKDSVFKIEDELSSTPTLVSPKLNEIQMASDDNGESDEPAPVLPEYPTPRVRSAILDVIDSFDNRDLEVPRQLARVANRLRPITTEHLKDALAGSEGEGVKASLQEILQWANRAISLV
jgi:hypothetical protein